MFIGREDQLNDLKALCQKKTASLVTCRGRRRIGKSTLIAEVDEKARRLRRNHDVSIKTALVYAGTLAPIVDADGYFDAIVPIETILGFPPK